MRPGRRHLRGSRGRRDHIGLAEHDLQRQPAAGRIQPSLAFHSNACGLP